MRLRITPPFTPTPKIRFIKPQNIKQTPKRQKRNGTMLSFARIHRPPKTFYSINVNKIDGTAYNFGSAHRKHVKKVCYAINSQ